MATLDQRVDVHCTGDLLRQRLQLRRGVSHAGIVRIGDIRLASRRDGKRLDDVDQA